MKCCMRSNAGLLRHSGTMLPRPIGADYAVIVSAKEVEAGVVTLRDMQTGEQELIELDDAVLRIMGEQEGGITR